MPITSREYYKCCVPVSYEANSESGDTWDPRAPALAAGELLSTGWDTGYDVFQAGGPHTVPKRLRTPSTSVADNCGDWLTLSPDGTVDCCRAHGLFTRAMCERGAKRG